jgi:hypothetical protein
MTVIPTTLAATLLIQVGYFLWKVSAEGQPRIGQASAVDVARSLLTDWRWMLGFAATTAGWVLFVQATSLSPSEVAWTNKTQPPRWVTSAWCSR